MKRGKYTLPDRLTNKQFIDPVPHLSISVNIIEKHYPLHWHEFYEAELILSGSGKHIVNGTTYELSEGSIFLLTPADFHEVFPDMGTPLKLINIKFSDEMLAEALRELLFNTSGLICAKLAGYDLKWIKHEFELLCVEFNQLELCRDILIKGALERILITLIRYKDLDSAGSTESYPGVLHTSINKALAYIHNHFREPLTLKGIAQKVHLSANYFSECFHKAAGSSFQSYVLNTRLNFARSLITVSDLPVTEICYASGFNSLPHFTRAFKKVFGSSPNSYRKTVVLK